MPQSGSARRAQPCLTPGKRPQGRAAWGTRHTSVCAWKARQKHTYCHNYATSLSRPCGRRLLFGSSPGCAPCGRLPGVKHGCALRALPLCGFLQVATHMGKRAFGNYYRKIGATNNILVLMQNFLRIDSNMANYAIKNTTAMN